MDSQIAASTQLTNNYQGLADSEQPVMIPLACLGQSLLEAFGYLRTDIESLVCRVGGVLVRGFGVSMVDVLMLDNMLVAHARSPFKGQRKVVVAMAEGYSNLSND